MGRRQGHSRTPAPRSPATDAFVNSPNRAIILAAGQGKRLLPLTEARPKCLIELSGRSLLAWQLMRLQAAGVDETVIVTVFRADAVEA